MHISDAIIRMRNLLPWSFEWRESRLHNSGRLLIAAMLFALSAIQNAQTDDELNGVIEDVFGPNDNNVKIVIEDGMGAAADTAPWSVMPSSLIVTIRPDVHRFQAKKLYPNNPSAQKYYVLAKTRVDAYHERVHVTCCHLNDDGKGGSGGDRDTPCQMIQAEIRGYLDACASITPEMSQEEKDAVCAVLASWKKLLDAKAKAWADCVGKPAGNGTPSGGEDNGYKPHVLCSCTQINVPIGSPSGTDPCAKCKVADLPKPGPDPADPFPNGLVAKCPSCP